MACKAYLRKLFVYNVGRRRYTVCMLELLAPSGDINSFNTAIACGADAVYLGLSNFNARRKAENFTNAELADCIARAHFFGVKVYITLNTLVGDGEIGEALRLARSAVEAGADAFIVQDIGLAACLRQAFPNVALHASTQLGIHNLFGARQAEKLGFKRVVLSRETKLEDIKAIRSGTQLEIEYFVQGALCVAFSGNCYLSAAECGASGNRGLCKQLCRLPYTAETGGKRAEGYLLSARDLCLANSLKELADAGVTSFKIEGRMRREGYVGSAVKVYRRLLDEIDSSKISKDELLSLKQAFLRGSGYLDRAYLDGGTPDVIEKRFNNHTGIKVGYVKKVKPFKADLYEVTVISDRPIVAGDGLKFFAEVKGEMRELASVGVGDVRQHGVGEYTFVTKTAVKEDWQANVILSKAQEESVAGERRFNHVSFEVSALVGKPLAISVTCNGITEKVSGEICQKAINQPTDIAAFEQQIKKTGDSGFVADSVVVHTDGVFVAKSVINGLRRQVLDKLKASVIAANSTKIAVNEDKINEFSQGISSSFEHRRMRFYHSNEVQDGASPLTDIRKAELAVLCPSAYTVQEITAMLKSLSLEAEKVALQLPVIANGRDIAVLEALLAELPQIKTLVSENIYGFEFASNGYKVIAGAGHNVLNTYAIQQCIALGASEALPSLESGRRTLLTGDELPFMTFAHCPYKTVFENDCDHCSYTGDMTLSREKRKYRVRRTKLHNCYFGLFEL